VNTYRIEVSAPIGAPAHRAYQLIADYHRGHPSIVPPRAFSNLQVLAGGVGAGTKIEFDMKVFGRVIRTVGDVTEPEPGRVLCETYPATGAVTTFVVDPSADGASCRVTIRTEMPSPKHPLAFLERFAIRGFLVGVYAEEIQRLEERARADS
jgi:hypothetical protein